MRTYRVTSGYEGRLDVKTDDDNNNNNEPLEWQSLDKPHTFYAWNIPWEGSDLYSENCSDKPDADITDDIKIHFYDSKEGDEGYGKYKNNSIYENFVGAKSASYSYREHGKYIDLTFHHLVSKINIGKFILIENSGAVQADFSANITFIGMPKEATFYPHPTGENEGKRPFVEYDKKQDYSDQGASYFIDNNSTIAPFYICPEIDFDKIDYQIHIVDDRFKGFDTYYGTFNEVEFIREGKGYDSKDDGKILHAGEEMTINITLIPGMGPGLSVIINNWSTESEKDVEYHTHPGIYSDAEVKEVLDAFRSQSKYDDNSDAERLFEMYGEERDIDDDGNKEKVFPLYDNVSTDSNIFPVPKGYVVDGMGHTITLKTNQGSNGDFGSSKTYYNIGPVRDVWLSDAEGKNKIYIDSDGYVWYYAENGDFVQGQQLEPLEGEEKSYDISVDGIVHKSTYYNNNISGS